jgi:hypothetical protein
LFFLVVFLLVGSPSFCQDSLGIAKTDTSKKYVIKRLGNTLGQTFGLKKYKPEEKPKVALVRSLFLPGWGQYTNGDYWKMPLVYGAAGAGYYFGIRQNQLKFISYRAALEKIVAYERSNVFLAGNAITGNSIFLTVKDETNAFDINTSKVYILQGESTYYTLSPISDTNGKKVSGDQQFNAVLEENVNENLVRGPLAKERIQSGTNQFRRYRDLSRIGFAVGWLLLAVEANVSGHMKTFDSSDDISFKFEPKLINTPQGTVSALALNIKF